MLILDKKQLAINLIEETREKLIKRSSINIGLKMNAINNAVIDVLVKRKLMDYPDTYSESKIRAEVEKEYYREIKPYYDKIIRDSRTSNSIQSTLEIQRNLNNKVFQASDRTMAAINGNRDFVKNAMSNITDRPLSGLKKQLLKEYTNITGEKPIASRRNILDELGKAVGSEYVGKNGQPFYHVDNPELSYRQIDRIAYNIKRGVIESTKHDRFKAINQERIDEGREPLYIAKIWTWSGKDDTRHENMDGQIVGIDDPFEVVNEVTGDVDYLMFPQDYNNDDNNCSNLCNCGCGFDGLTRFMVEDEGLDPADFIDNDGNLLSNTDVHDQEIESPINVEENVPLSQMFNEEELNIATGQFEKENKYYKNKYMNRGYYGFNDSCKYNRSNWDTYYTTSNCIPNFLPSKIRGFFTKNNKTYKKTHI